MPEGCVPCALVAPDGDVVDGLVGLLDALVVLPVVPVPVAAPAGGFAEALVPVPVVALAGGLAELVPEGLGG